MITIDEQTLRMGSVFTAKGNKADVELWIATITASHNCLLTKKNKIGDNQVSAIVERVKP